MAQDRRHPNSGITGAVKGAIGAQRSGRQGHAEITGVGAERDAAGVEVLRQGRRLDLPGRDGGLGQPDHPVLGRAGQGFLIRTIDPIGVPGEIRRLLCQRDLAF